MLKLSQFAAIARAYDVPFIVTFSNDASYAVTGTDDLAKSIPGMASEARNGRFVRALYDAGAKSAGHMGGHGVGNYYQLESL